MSDINLRFITGVRWYKGQLEMLNHLTYIYDSQWNPNNTVKSTLPVSFFHVKSCREVMSSEISQKQMLFYNSSADPTNNDAKLDSGLLNVVADNIVIKPKMYKLDVIVPYKRLSLLDQSFVWNTHTMQAMHEAIIRHGNSTSRQVDEIFGAWASLKSPLTSFITTLIRTLVSASMSESGEGLDDFLHSVTSENDYNKESLEAMWRMRHIVRMKMWNSWQYKYVAISDIEITKEGTEDGVYEATITLQEMPIVTMNNTASIKSWAGKVMNAKRNALLQTRGQAVISLLNNASDVFGQNN